MYTSIPVQPPVQYHCIHGDLYSNASSTAMCKSGSRRKLSYNHGGLQGIAVYGCCPGYCVTDMTSGGGNKTAAEGADTPVWLALQPIGFIAVGALYGERQEVPW